MQIGLRLDDPSHPWISLARAIVGAHPDEAHAKLNVVARVQSSYGIRTPHAGTEIMTEPAPQGFRERYDGCMLGPEAWDQHCAAIVQVE